MGPILSLLPSVAFSSLFERSIPSHSRPVTLIPSWSIKYFFEKNPCIVTGPRNPRASFRLRPPHRDLCGYQTNLALRLSRPCTARHIYRNEKNMVFQDTLQPLDINIWLSEKLIRFRFEIRVALRQMRGSTRSLPAPETSGTSVLVYLCMHVARVGAQGCRLTTLKALEKG